MGGGGRKEREGKRGRLRRSREKGGAVTRVPLSCFQGWVEVAWCQEEVETEKEPPQSYQGSVPSGLLYEPEKREGWRRGEGREEREGGGKGGERREQKKGRRGKEGKEGRQEREGREERDEREGGGKGREKREGRRRRKEHGSSTNIKPTAPIGIGQ